MKAGGTGGVAVLTTEVIDICRIYDKVTFKYKLSDFLLSYNLQEFSKLFNLVKYIDDDDFLLKIKDYKVNFDNESLNKKISNLFSRLDVKMTKEKIISDIESNNLLDSVLNSKSGRCIFDVVKEYEMKNNYYVSDTETFFNFIQIYYIYNDKKKINDKIKYIDSKIFKDYCVNIFEKCNTVRKKVFEIHTNSRGKFLRLKLPRVNAISNGQRDLLCFVSSFLQMISSAKSIKKPRVCVIDEIFDYLDGSNLLFVQYLISKYINDYKNIYPTIFIIMTHLNPEDFNTFILKKRKVYYIDNSNKARIIDESFRKIILNRNDLSLEFKNILESKFIHYNPDYNFNSEGFTKEELKFCQNNLNVAFFVDILKDNLNNFVNGNSYDPLLLACGMRYFSEKYQYSLLYNNSLKEEYIKLHKTQSKNEFMQRHNIHYDDIVDILCILYNEVLHSSKNNYDEIIKRFILRVDTIVIRSMLSDFIKNTNVYNLEIIY